MHAQRTKFELRLLLQSKLHVYWCVYVCVHRMFMLITSVGGRAPDGARVDVLLRQHPNSVPRHLSLSRDAYSNEISTQRKQRFYGE